MNYGAVIFPCWSPCTRRPKKSKWRPPASFSLKTSPSESSRPRARRIKRVRSSNSTSTVRSDFVVVDESLSESSLEVRGLGSFCDFCGEPSWLDRVASSWLGLAVAGRLRCADSSFLDHKRPCELFRKEVWCRPELCSEVLVACFWPTASVEIRSGTFLKVVSTKLCSSLWRSDCEAAVGFEWLRSVSLMTATT